MDPMELDENGLLQNEISGDRLLPPVDSSTCDLLGEHDISPRIGANYQAEIPEQVDRSKYLLLSGNVDNSKSGPTDYLVGLPVPVLLISQEHENTKAEKIKARQSLNPSRKGRGESGSLNVDPENVRLPDEPMIKPGYSDYSFVPLSETGCWTDLEISSFLLGLYIFEKNFVQLKRLVETKNLGEIMCFYYGKFYRSHEYYRWSDSRKMKSRRCVFGQKIFTGLRQQEFLSRIFGRVSEDCKNALLEVSKSFGEGKMSLEDYVFLLKDMLGMNMLVEAIGIGKGKQDLTGMALETSRANQSNQLRPEIPIGKACAHLTPSEIVKFLSGDYRLSKARSNDLFWEAVWPRLLARGWHSEEPKDQSYAAKNPLVFLVPGVKKFSRRRLVKGNHYFDSVTDILSKVALEPSLIELDTEVNGSKRNEEELEEKSNTNLDEDDVPTRRRRFYLQLPNRGAESLKLAVLDSGKEDEICKLRELGPVAHGLFPIEVNPGRAGITPETSVDSDDVDTSVSKKREINLPNASNDLLSGNMIPDGKGLDISAPKLENDTSYTVSESTPVNNTGGNVIFEDKRSKKEVKKRQSIQRTKEDNIQGMGPVNKRARRLTVCNQLEPTNITVSSAIFPALEAQLPTQSMDLCNFAENICPKASSQEKLYVSAELRGRHGDDNTACEDVKCHVVSDPQESSQRQTLIDLNIPQVPPENFDIDDNTPLLLPVDESGSKDNEASTRGVDTAPQPAPDVISSDQQPNMNQQRRGTRNRPPTSRALEALANGFLTVASRRKAKEAGSSSRRPPRPSQHSRGNAPPGIVMQSPHHSNLETPEYRTELSTTSASFTHQGNQNVAGANADQVPINVFEVVPPGNKAPPDSGY